jgi:anti-sigma-K factor RskA
MTMDEDRQGLAAEYALGTLDTDERAQADALMLLDPEFAAEVRRWERRLGELNVLVAPVEPGEPIWTQIRAKVAEAAPNEAVWPVPPESAPIPQRDSAEIFDLTQRMRRWRQLSVLTGALAAGLVGFVVVRDYRPDLLPAGLAPRPQVVERVIEKEVAPPPQPVQFVAVFQRDEQSPAFLMSVDLDQRTVSVRQVAAEKLPDKSYQLWIAPQPGEPPRSLGVLADDAGVKANLAAYDPSVINKATFGISLEPRGGSPTGQPTGPVIHARLLEVPKP